jgi:hypothetical protein
LERRSARGLLGALERTESLPACGKSCCGAGGRDDAHAGPPRFSRRVCVSKGRALETAVDPMNLGGSGASGLIEATVGGVLRSDERLDSEGPDSEALDSGGLDSEGFDSERPDCECFDSARLDCGCLGCGSFDLGCSDCECLDCLRECEFVILLDP